MGSFYSSSLTEFATPATADSPLYQQVQNPNTVHSSGKNQRSEPSTTMSKNVYDQAGELRLNGHTCVYITETMPPQLKYCGQDTCAGTNY